MARLTERAISLAACAIFAGPSLAQSPTDKPTFEVVSVKRSVPGNNQPNGCRGGPGSSDPGMLTCTNSALAMLVSTAYNLQFYELISPEWLIHGGSEEGYDIVARIPPGATKEQYRLMLQKLLADRFHLAAHRGSRDLPKYALVLGKGKPRLTQPVEPPPPGPGVAQAIVNGHLRFSLHNKPLVSLADFLTTVLTGPVSDETGIAGNYDITLEFMPDDRWRGFPYLPRPNDAAGADAVPNLITAIQEQLGLKLETRKGPVSVLVVDHADKAPVEN